MYYLLEWPTFINVDLRSLIIKKLISSPDREFLAVLTNKDILFFHNKSFTHNLLYSRSEESLRHYGESVSLVWKSDNSLVAVGTTFGFVLLITLDRQSSNKAVLITKDNGVSMSSMWNGKHEIPGFSAQLMDVMNFENPIADMCTYHDDLLVSTKDGNINRLTWAGGVQYTQKLTLRQIPFYHDLEQSRASRICELGTYCRRIEWCPSLDGLLMLLSSGRAALLNIPTDKLDPNQVEGVWAVHLKNGTCMAANIRFRVVAFGGKAGDGVVYGLDDATGALQILHRLRISSKEYPDASGVVGSVVQLRWTPDENVLAMVWERAGFCLWSVYGSLLFSTLGEKMGLGRRLQLSAAEWGPEGYHMWTVSNVSSNPDEDPQMQLVIFNMTKSALTTNPTMHNHEHLVLQSSNCLYISEREEMTPGRQWHTATLPSIYLNSNWPIKYTAIDGSGKNVVVAGRTGFALYSLASRRWKVFGNETQEKSMQVCGGVTWWSDVICLTCTNLVDNKDEIRLYNSTRKLDNAFCYTVKLTVGSLMINTFRNTLIILSQDSTISMYTLHDQPNKVPGTSLVKIQEVDITTFIPIPSCVVAMTLTSLRSEINIARHTQQCAAEAESILVNYSGRLYMFQRDLSSLQPPDHYFQSGGPKGTKQVQCHSPPPLDGKLPFMTPSIVASSVEIVWTTWRDSATKKHLTDSLWLNCGAQGMKVWLPLITKDSRTPGFMSKRIMLPFEVDIFPLVVLFEEALLIGAGNDFTNYMSSASSGDNTNPLHAIPYAIIEKSSQMYLHHIVKQLLRKNLGVHALDLSQCCRDLPYFHHVLELLLHEVLEKEATSKEPIPDPLLPRVVAFIQEFPEFLDTVAHCARKTEVALWPYLFATVGNPRDLFESCLQTGHLDTAASYLIVIQNTEKSSLSKHHAITLLEAALNESKWNLVKDLMRFLKTIDPQDFSSDQHSPYYSASISGGGSTGSGTAHGSGAPPPRPLKRQASRYVSPSETSTGSVPLQSQSGSGGGGVTPSTSGTVGAGTDAKHHLKQAQDEHRESESSGKNRRHHNSTPGGVQQGTISGSVTGNINNAVLTSGSGHQSLSGSSNHLVSSPAGNFKDEVDMLLHLYARKLLASCRLFDLSRFAANTHFNDQQFIAWLGKERHQSACIPDYVAALTRLHTDFRWPLPIFIPRVPPPSSGVNPEHLLSAVTPGPPHLANGGPSLPPLTAANLKLSSAGGAQSMASLAKTIQLDGSTPPPHPGGKAVDWESAHSDDVFLKPGNRSVPGGARCITHIPPSEGGGSSLQGSSSDLESHSLNSMSMASTTGGVLHDETTYLHELELMTQELANKGPEESQVQLRYLFHIFMEAECYEWCTVIGVLLRDPLSIIHVVTSATTNKEVPVKQRSLSLSSANPIAPAGSVASSASSKGPVATYQSSATSILRGLDVLEEWSETSCLGYKSFLLALRPQLNMIVNSSQPLMDPAISIQNRRTSKSSTSSAVSGLTRNISLDDSAKTRELRLALMLSTPEEEDTFHEEALVSGHQSAPASALGLREDEKAYLSSHGKSGAPTQIGGKRRHNSSADSDSILSQSFDHLGISTSCFTEASVNKSHPSNPHPTPESHGNGTDSPPQPLLLPPQDSHNCTQKSKSSGLTGTNSSASDKKSVSVAIEPSTIDKDMSMSNQRSQSLLWSAVDGSRASLTTPTNEMVDLITYDDNTATENEGNPCSIS